MECPNNRGPAPNASNPTWNETCTVSALTPAVCVSDLYEIILFSVSPLKCIRYQKEILFSHNNMKLHQNKTQKLVCLLQSHN